MEYTIVVRININDLIDDVNAFINAGWKPYGSLAIDSQEHAVMYLQPMTRTQFKYPTSKDNNDDKLYPPATP